MCEINVELFGSAVFLMILTICDIKTKTLPEKMLIGWSLWSILFFFVGGETDWKLKVAGACMGLLFFGISAITREAIGYGDGWVIALIGCSLGLWELLKLLAIAWTALSVTGMLYLVKKKWNRKKTIPMLPYLLAGYGIILLERM